MCISHFCWLHPCYPSGPRPFLLSWIAVGHGGSPMYSPSPSMQCYGCSRTECWIWYGTVYLGFKWLLGPSGSWWSTQVRKVLALWCARLCHEESMCLLGHSLKSLYLTTGVTYAPLDLGALVKEQHTVFAQSTIHVTWIGQPWGILVYPCVVEIWEPCESFW